MHADDEYPNGWARLLGEVKRREGWTQQQMADRAHVNRNTIRRWLSGEVADPDTASIKQVAEALGIDYDTASRAALGAQEAAKDDNAIRDVLESDFEPEYKQDIIDMIHRRRAEAEDAIRRDIDIMLRRAPKREAF